MRRIAACILLLLPPAVAEAQAPSAPLSADQVAARAEAVDGGTDGAARVSFVISEPGRKDVRQDFAMIWKRYAEGPVAYKVVFFPEFPPDRKGYNWMGYLARPGQGDDAAWMFLPDLRAVRRIQGPEGGEEDPFHRSLLAGPELIPRADPADTHALLPDDVLGGRPVYRLEVAHGSRTYPYPRSVLWIDKEWFTTLRAEHFTPAGRRARVVDFTWGRIGAAWVWEKVTAEDPDKGTRTTLAVSDQKVDVNLPERAFSEATLKSGPDRFLGP
jgi:hypothetical protein